MQKLCDQDRETYPGLIKPGVVTVLVKGRSVYISSSLAGGGSLIYEPNEAETGSSRWKPGVFKQPSHSLTVNRALLACQAFALNGAGHRTGANCGEPMAALTFVKAAPSQDIERARIVTWGNFLRDKGGKKVAGVMNPCFTPKQPSDGQQEATEVQSLSTINTWGCSQFIGKSWACCKVDMHERVVELTLVGANRGVKI